MSDTIQPINTIQNSQMNAIRDARAQERPKEKPELSEKERIERTETHSSPKRVEKEEARRATENPTIEEQTHQQVQNHQGENPVGYNLDIMA